MVRMDAPRASLSREMCAFLKGVGCIVVSSLAVYLVLSGLSTTGAEVVGYIDGTPSAWRPKRRTNSWWARRALRTDAADAPLGTNRAWTMRGIRRSYGLFSS